MCNPYATPIVLDLDGDGLELTSMNRSKARFDLDGDGRLERLGWIGRGDGILALDRDGSGRIDSIEEVTFRQDFRGAGTDLEGLYAYDTDGDGFLTASDSRFTDFLVWIDGNGNGKSEKKELFSLQELGVSSIGLERSNVALLNPNLPENQVLGTSVFTTVDGRVGIVGDVALFSNWSSNPDCGCGSALAVEGTVLWML